VEVVLGVVCISTWVWARFGRFELVDVHLHLRVLGADGGGLRVGRVLAVARVYRGRRRPRLSHLGVRMHMPWRCPKEGCIDVVLLSLSAPPSIGYTFPLSLPAATDATAPLDDDLPRTELDHFRLCLYPKR
jgi:hypothetical protein